MKCAMPDYKWEEDRLSSLEGAAFRLAPVKFPAELSPQTVLDNHSTDYDYIFRFYVI